MQSVKGAKLLNINCLLFLSDAAAVLDSTALVLLTSMYALMQSHKLEFNIMALNLI